ncbi:MAG: aryl-sulfate sulfotransferase [Candidatus Methylomirabilis sp.]|nr:aryl-sulfate sulfotransferase [Deltaproteobacteria bacterium]
MALASRSSSQAAARRSGRRLVPILSLASLILLPILGPAPARAEPPEISGLLLKVGPPEDAPYILNIWAVTIIFTTDVPATPEVVMHADEPGRPRESTVIPRQGRVTPAPATFHVVVALGLRPGVPHRFTIRATGLAGERTEVSSNLVLGTGYSPALPGNFPIGDDWQVRRSKPRRMGKGVTIFPMISADFFNADVNAYIGHLYGVDARGRMVWYNESPLRGGTASDVEHRHNGNFLILEGDPSTAKPAVVERDVFGRYVNVWPAEDYDLPIVHHAVSEMPRSPERIAAGAEYGDFVFLGTEVRTVSGFALGPEVSCTTCNLVGDLVVEIDPNTRAEVLRHSSFDFMPALYRVKPNFADRGYDRNYPEYSDGTLDTAGTRDYTHGNAVVYDPRDDSFVVSLRHQDLVCKIDRATGALKWVLGEDDPGTDEDDDWPFIQLTPESLYPNHQHDSTILPAPDLPDGHIRILLYDNGNARTLFDLPELPVTQAAVYDIDEAALTGVMSASFPDADYPRGGFGPFVGSAQLLAESGTVLVNDGAFTVEPPKPSPMVGANYTRIAEYAVGDREKVFELVIGYPRALERVAYTSYRAVRIPSLYGDVGETVGGVPLSSGYLGFEVEMRNIVNGVSVHDNPPGVVVLALRKLAGL